MRGLKHKQEHKLQPIFQSHLLQMRGLKQAFESGKDLNTVASFTDAWIETRIYIRSKSKAFVASFTDAWIETNSNRNYGGSAKVASFTDAWIETPTKHGQSPAKPSRIFYRCVD